MYLYIRLYPIYSTIIGDIYPLLGCHVCKHTHTCHVRIDTHLHSNPFYMKVVTVNFLLFLHIHIGLQRYKMQKSIQEYTYIFTHINSDVYTCVMQAYITK